MAQPLIYLDNAATSFPKPSIVYQSVDHTLRTISGSPGRSGHSMAFKANKIVFEARQAIARLIGATDSSRIIFTSGATEALNLAINGLPEPGDHIITSTFEHNSVTRPVFALNDVAVTKITPSSDGRIDPENIKNAIQSNTRLIAITHASNVTGVIQPIGDIGKIAKERGIAFLVDASQSAGAAEINVSQMNISLLAVSGHKGLLGPQGTGFLYIGEGVRPRPLKTGGTGSGSPLDSQPEEMPDRYESGTLNTPGIAGLGAGVQYLLDNGLDDARAHKNKLCGALTQALGKMRRVALLTPDDVEQRLPLVSFNISGLDPVMVSFRLDQDFGILSRAGLHCSPDTHKWLNTFPSGCVRLSPGLFNTRDDIDKAINAIFEISREK